MTASALSQPLSSAQELEPPTIHEFAEIAQLLSDLDQLSAEGLIESFTDERGVERFRPRKAAQAA